MYRTKKDVDKHVESLLSKLSVKEFKTRAYSIARLYFEVGDYANCQKYVEQYVSQKDNNAAAHKLLGQALQRLGQKEKALEQYKTSLDIDPTQTSTILDICELLADDEVAIDPGRAKYWCEKAEAIFPRHPVTFRLRERLVTVSNPNPEALVNLLKAELEARPKDAVLHARLLKHYLRTNQVKEAFDHSCNVEFSGNAFLNNYAWYDTLAEILKHNWHNTNDWLYQLLLLTIRERLCVLSLTETPSGSSKSLVDSTELLHTYDLAIESIAKAGSAPGFGEFHAGLLQHHRGQFAFHAATLLLKKAKKDQLSWREATRSAAPLMLIAWQSVPLDSKVNWLKHAPEKQKIAVSRWYTEGTYRCSQSGHYLLSNIQDKSQSFLDRISQSCSGTHWRDKLYEKIFTNRDHLAKIKSSHFVSNAYGNLVLRLPRKIEVEAYDVDAQREYPNSLHHFVWTLLNYKNYSHFKCTLFDMLKPSATNCGPETLNKLDVQAFLYCAALTTRQQKSNEVSYVPSDKPSVLPANITDLLCSLSQMKWWDCAYKFSQNELGYELTDIRATLSRGIEVVRCIDNHGLDPELLCTVGNIFSERAKLTTAVDDKNNLEIRACLYYSSAIPLLEKLKSKVVVKMPEKRLFDYTHKELSLKEINCLLEESKLYIAVNHLNESEYEKAVELLSNLKSPQAYYHLSQAYKKIALEDKNISRENNASMETKSKFATLLAKAKSSAYKALDRVKDSEMSKNHPLYNEIQQLIEEIEININKIDSDFSGGNNDIDAKYSSDENISSADGERLMTRNNYQVFRNISSTPKQPTSANLTNYRTAVDSHVLETTQGDTQFLDRIESQIKTLQRKLADDFMEQTKSWFEENRKLANQIMSTIQSDIQNTADQFKLLKISVDQIKDQIDVGDLKKQIAELKKDVNKLKKASSEQTIDESDLYNLDDEYRTNDGASSFTAQLPFQTPQVVPPFNQRLVPPFPVPPNPYQLYSQNLYNLYNQYSQFAQTPSVPGAPPLFDPTRTPVNYPGVYPTADQMYLDIAHLVHTNLPAPAVPPIPAVPPVPTMPSAQTVPPVSVQPPPSIPTSKPAPKVEAKETSKPLPVNVVITSSDPLPTCTTAPAPILSVTIPPKHIKGTPHNYQIAMPTANETKVMSPPVFSFPAPGNKPATTTITSPFPNWSQSNVFKTTCSTTISVESLFSSPKTGMVDNCKSEIDGHFTGFSPNTSLNKSRTLSERSNTSVDNYDPCPDFKPIIPLPDEVKVTTGEEDETAIFSARAKLFRFVDKQWKERGIGEMKLLKHNTTGKVRVLMRREQIHKICANHIITTEIEIKPMKNETKAYFWVANDFADETVVLEKFCIRFKTADIALQFYETFEKSRHESSNVPNTSTPKPVVSAQATKVNTPSTPQNQSNAFIKVMSGVSEQPKSQFGGFTFSSTPTFKTVSDDTKPHSGPSEPATSKVNVFSGISFKTTTSSPFSNIFSTTAAPAISTSSPVQKQETPNKLNNSDVVEEFEPNVEFTPVVPLPALIDQKTGEEDETVLFEHRAKLLRFDASSKEWKERGLGTIKLLVHKENIQKLRLLMRREQIMKVCCNHAVTKEMTFQKMPNMDKAVTWCAKDYSDGELVAETFCLRFKTVQACDDFIGAIKTAQSKIKDESKAAKEEQNASKQINQVGFGDKFKPKSGSWCCNACYTNNLESFNKCACCEQPKPDAAANETSPNTPSTNWGEKFKPKTGSWECNACLIRNEANVDYCSACDSPKDPSMPKKENKLASDNAPKFSFGIPAQQGNTVVKNEVTTSNIASGWGDKFKPKADSWECKQCFVRNESSVEKCSACASLKDPNADKNESKSVFVNVTSGPKFNFGIPASTFLDNANVKLATPTPATSIFDGTGAHKFSFGIPTNTPEKIPSVMAFGEQNTSIFGTPKLSAANEAVNLSSKNVSQSQSATPLKPALLPTPQPDTNTFGSKDGGTFDFVFKPKTPPKGKSPAKSPKDHKGDESDENEYASEDEGVHIHFSPVVPLPDKVAVVTGEENEIELYGHRAKLFRFTSGEWKERGIGIVKILKHRDTGKLRVVMRREQVLKICLNHALTPDIMYTAKDDKTWLFAANDFTDGELSLQQFCLRFKSKEIAQDFKDAIDKTREHPTAKRETESVSKDNNSDDVVFVNEIQATAEEKQKARDLMLPENFFTYQSRVPCQGCRGCEDEDDVKPVSTTSNKQPTSLKAFPTIASALTSTPVKTTISSFQSPVNSFYGTPANFDKTIDNSIFRTPLGSIGTNANSSSPMSSNGNNSGNDTTNKENTFIQKSIFSGLGDQSSLFTTPQNKSGSLFGAGDTSAGSMASNSILAPPKLSTLNTSEGSKAPESVFGTSQAKSVFGENKSSLDENKPVFGENKSIFGEKKSAFGENKSSLDENKPVFGENKSIFGEKKSAFGENKSSLDENKPVFGENKSIFGEKKSAFGENKSIFGENKSIFGENKSVFGENKSIFGEKKSVFGENKSIFGENKSIFGENKPLFGNTGSAISTNKSIFGFSSDVKKEDNPKSEVKSLFGTEDQKPVNLFSGATQGSLFGPGALAANQQHTPGFGSTGLNSSKLPETQQPFDNGKSIFSTTNETTLAFSATSEQTKPDDTSMAIPSVQKTEESKPGESAKVETPFKVDNSLSFAALSSGTASDFSVQKKPDFKWEGAGQQLFGQAASKEAGNKSKDEAGADESGGGAEEEYDPHYEPIVPLPDKIEVTTGEEDEVKMFGERCKLYRYNDKTREWKERGVGEMKILYHPGRKTYRLLLRREQVHKAVLNMLLYMDLELRPMTNSDRAWTWAGRNFAESPSGEQETLAVRFKSVELATAFRDKVIECVKKFQALAAQAIREEKEKSEIPSQGVAPLRLPKHLEDSARADSSMFPKAVELAQDNTVGKSNGEVNKTADVLRQVHFEEPEPEQQRAEDDDDDEDYEHDYDQNEDYDAYYNDEEEESAVYYSCDGEVLVQQGAAQVSCEQAHLQVLFDQDIYSPKILVTDNDTGEILADMLIHTDTEFHMNGDSCTWSGVDYTSNDPVDKTVTAHFHDGDTAMQFYDSCETSKSATYTSTDPES